MRLQGYSFAFVLCLSVAAARAQDPAVPSTAPATAQTGGVTTPKLTPEQEHERQIRVFDPLDKTDPTAADTNTSTSTDIQSPADNSRRPSQALPGSAAAGNQSAPVNPHSQGPQVVSGDADEPVQDYSGPAVLSRTYTISRPMVPRQVRWTPSVGVTTIYDTGLTGGQVNSDGSLANQASNGEAVTWSLVGRHFWKHDQFGLDYSGNYSRYSSNSGYNGSNEFVNVDYGHEISRHLLVNLVESGSSTSQGYALLDSNTPAGGSIANVNLSASPTTQILDQGTKQFTSMADVTWQKSARLSLNFGGGYFAVARSGGLYGNIGYQAQGDINYRYTRVLTIGMYYNYSNYVFSHHIQTSDTNVAGGILSYALSGHTQLRMRAGVARSESLGYTSVPINPAIALLVGRSTAIVDDYGLHYFSDLSGELVKDFGQKRNANLSYARGIAPGNGLLLASVQEVESAGFTMLFHKRFNLTGTIGRSTLTSTAQNMGSYGSNYVSFSASRNYSKGMIGTFEVDYRRFLLTTTPVLQSQFRVSLGVSWSRTAGEGY